MKLRTRFFLSHGVSVACGVLLCLGALYGGAKILLAREAESRQQQQLSDFAVVAREAALNNEELGLVSFMRRNLEDPCLAAASYEIPAEGLRLAVPPQLEHDPALDGGEDAVLADGRRVRIVRKDFAAGSRKGRVSLAYLPELLASQQERQLRPWLGLGAASALAALMLGSLLALWLSQQMSGPLKHLRQGTRLVREGKLESVVEVSRADELGDLARDFNAMTQQLKELEELKRDFVAGVTHDLGTPLQAMRSSLRLLQDPRVGRINVTQAELLLNASNAAENLTAFIQNLLTVAKIEAGKVEPYFETFDPAEELADLGRLYQPQAVENGLDLQLQAEPGKGKIKADRTQFRQMAMNLISNALKYTEAGHVKVTLAPGRNRWILKVSDSGPGIDPKYHELIFDKFFRVRPAEGTPMRQGSGLGLSIARGLARGHGGEVSMHSEPGKGSSFILELPENSVEAP